MFRCVKSIITILLCFVFCILIFVYPEPYTDTFKSIITTVITFYFAHQIDKHTGGNGDANNKTL